MCLLEVITKIEAHKMPTKESLTVLVPTTVVETFILIATRVTTERPATIFCYALGVNVILLAIWSIFIWPFLFNPLRHLPTVKVMKVLQNISHANRSPRVLSLVQRSSCVTHVAESQ